jgi:hypothetical protein
MLLLILGLKLIVLLLQPWSHVPPNLRQPLPLAIATYAAMQLLEAAAARCVQRVFPII